jgi:hypothetical protein
VRTNIFTRRVTLTRAELAEFAGAAVTQALEGLSTELKNAYNGLETIRVKDFTKMLDTMAREHRRAIDDATRREQFR